MYKITLNKEQAELLVKALDLFSRVGCGQWEEILRHPTLAKRIMQSKTGSPVREARAYIDSAKKIITGFDGGVSEGITTADEPNQVAYDMLQVLQHRLDRDANRENGIGVRNYLIEPTQWSDSPMIEISKED